MGSFINGSIGDLHDQLCTFDVSFVSVQRILRRLFRELSVQRILRRLFRERAANPSPEGLDTRFPFCCVCCVLEHFTLEQRFLDLASSDVLLLPNHATHTRSSFSDAALLSAPFFSERPS